MSSDRDTKFFTKNILQIADTVNLVNEKMMLMMDLDENQ